MDPTPSPSPSQVVSDAAQAAPTWVIIVLLSLGGAVIAAMFAVTFYNLAAPRAAYKLLIGVKGRYKRGGADPRPQLLQRAIAGSAADPGDHGAASTDGDQDLSAYFRSATQAGQLGKRATRSLLAVGGFSLLTIALIGVLALDGDGIRDLRSSLIGAIVSLVAAIAGFYFGAAGSTGGSETSDEGDGASTGGSGDTTSPPPPKE